MRLKAPGFRLGTSYDLTFSPSAEWLATVGRQVTLWSVAQRRAFARNSLLRDPSYVAFAPDESCYAIKNTAGEIIVCSLPEGDPISRYTPDVGEEGCRLAFTRDASCLIDGSWGGKVVIRQARTMEELSTIEFGQSMVVGASHAADRDLWAFAVSARHGHPNFEQGADFIVLCILVAETLKEVKRFGPFINLTNMQLRRDGGQLAAIHGRTELLVLDVQSEERIATAPLEMGGTGSSLTWSPDGRILAAVHQEGISFFDAMTLQEIVCREDPYPSAVAFSADGALLGLGSWKEGVVLPVPDVIPSVESV
ncbi:hypothetical protein BH24GEM2_BH24GEM2_07670 [soil metagenome]